MILDSMTVSQMKGASKMLYESEYYSHSWVIENIKLDLYMEAPELQLHESKEFEKPYHAHTYYELLFSVGDDSVDFMYEEKRVPLTKNMFVITSPHYTHSTVTKHRDDLLSLGFTFKYKQVSESPTNDIYGLFDEMLSKNDCIIGHGDKILSELCEQAKCYSVPLDPLAKGSLSALFVLIIFRAFRLLQEKRFFREWIILPKERKQEKIYNTRIPSETIRKLNSVLADCFMTDVTLEDLSKKYYISPKQINRYMYSQYGQTFMQRKMYLRMVYAQKMLRESELSIVEISEKVGYHSINTFYSAFKMQFGITPHQYRLGKNAKKE